MRWQDYLSEPRPPFDYWRNDCSRWVDRYVQRRGWGSPMRAIDIDYRTERAALRRIAEGGSLVALWLRGMAAVGAQTCATEAMRPGDIGVVASETECGTGQASGIWTGERWAVLGRTGLVIAPAPALATWSLARG